MTIGQDVWMEKHRPKTLDEVVGHEAIIDRLKSYVEDDTVPHMLLSGPPGTGKTTTVTCFAREVFGENWRSNFHELNASDQRGIDDVRETIKPMAQASPAGDAPYKIIFLDEVDSMTNDAQPALRRIIEEYSDITRFFLSCNYPGKIIEAIQSRCVPLRFSALSDSEIEGLVERIAIQEDLEFESDDGREIEMIVDGCRGDARSAVKYLQTGSVNGKVTVEYLDSVIGSVDWDDLNSIVDMSVSGEFDEATELMRDMLQDGTPPQMLAERFKDVILYRDDFPEPGRHMALSRLAEADWRLLNGANPQIHLMSLLWDFHVSRHIDYNRYAPVE